MVLPSVGLSSSAVARKLEVAFVINIDSSGECLEDRRPGVPHAVNLLSSLPFELLTVL